MKLKKIIPWAINLILLIVIVTFITNKTESKVEMTDSSKNSSNPHIMLTESTKSIIQLPPPRMASNVSVENALAKRRSHRNYIKQSLSIEELSQILWAAYGVTQAVDSQPALRGGFKTAPSAGATYPLEIYALAGNVKGIKAGAYRYLPEGHRLKKIIDSDLRAELCKASLNQEMIAEAPVCLFFSAVYDRTTQRYGSRGKERYVCIDLGHSAQNVYLQAEAMGLGTCAIGAFDDEEVRKVMQLPAKEQPLYIMPVGRYYKESLLSDKILK